MKLPPRALFVIVLFVGQFRFAPPHVRAQRVERLVAHDRDQPAHGLRVVGRTGREAGPVLRGVVPDADEGFLQDVLRGVVPSQ